MPNTPDAAEGHWLSNKIWVIIIIAVVGFSGMVVSKYYELQAADLKNTQNHELFKQSVDTKFELIMEKLDEICKTQEKL